MKARFFLRAIGNASGGASPATAEKSGKAKPVIFLNCSF